MSRTISDPLKTHYASRDHTTAVLLKVILTNTTVLGFTSFNRDIVYDGVTYHADSGYSMRDVTTSAALNVDNTEAQGPAVFPNVTENDLLAGIWNFAYFELFEVNYADLTQGRLILRVGHVGEVKVERGMFTTEFRGLTEAYERTIGRIDSPSCDANLGDSRCAVNLGLFTSSGTVGAVLLDNATFFDTSLTQSGPGASIAITSITNANPGVVVIADNSLGITTGQAVTLSGILGPTSLNTTVVVRNLRVIGSNYAFDLIVDTTNTTDYPPYAGGGTLTPLGGTSGFFDGGVVTWITGLNAGLKMEIKSFVPGQVALQLPMPYLIQPGDTYSATAGCDKTFPTCRDRFHNAVNFRGEPYFPGQDKVIQVGRHQ